MAIEERLPRWVTIIAPKTDEEIARAKEIARKARFSDRMKHEPREPVEITRRQAATEDYVIEVAI